METDSSQTTKVGILKYSNAYAFTLVEMLVVISILGILAALLLPVLSKGKKKSQGIYCLNSGRQFIYALQMYTADNNDWMPPNPDNAETNAWIRGNMRVPADATNTTLLITSENSKLAQYLAYSAKPFKCPADTTTHVRTFSMNHAVGTKPYPPPTPVDGVWLNGNRTHVSGHPWQTYGKMTDSALFPAAGLWIFIDEDQYSINDGAFAVDMETPTKMIDWPGTYHNFACGLAFADGHSENHKWTDDRTHVTGGYDGARNENHRRQPGNADIVWLQQRTSIRAPQ